MLKCDTSAHNYAGIGIPREIIFKGMALKSNYPYCAHINLK